MKRAKRQPDPYNWATIRTLNDKDHVVDRRMDPALNDSLLAVKEKWLAKGEQGYPPEQFSLVSPGSEIYVGHYLEGVVIRLNENDREVVFLTYEMARAFGRYLVGDETPKKAP